MEILRTYKELITLPTFIERYNYLKIGGRIGEETFGFDRYINQMFYRSAEWKHARNFVIARDFGRDLAMEGYELPSGIIVHHMNPITPEDLKNDASIALDPNFLITVSSRTHQAVHFGDQSMLPKEPVVRRPNDTCPWRR